MRVLGRRLVFYLITALAAITVDFFIPRMMPGSPVEAILARLQGQITPGTIKALETQFGVGTKESVWSQYLLPVVPLLYGGAWAEFSTRNYTGWPSATNPYMTPVPNTPYLEYTVMQLKPTS